MASICVRGGDIQAANLKRNNNMEQQVYQITNEGDATRATRPRAGSYRGSRITSRNVKPLFLLLRMNIPFAYVILYTLLYSCPYVMGYSEQRFAIEPQDQVAVMGSRVTLPCRVVNKAGQLQWTKDDFGLGTHRHLVGYDRYKMVGSDEEGDYSLDIREVTLDDDAQYQCQVSSGPGGEPGIRSRYARLSVLVAPDPPKILQGSFIEVIEDSEQVFECVSTGGKPPAEITWVDGEGGVLNQNVVYTVQPMTDGRRFTARSTLRLIPKRYHDKQNLVCQAQNTADRAYKSATIKLEVKYAPTVRLFLKSNIAGGRIFEGDKLRLGCEAEGNPRNFTFKWYLNNQLMIPGNYSNELIITNLTREHNDNTVKCEVHNAVGKSADTKILEVSYGPKFIMKPQNIEGETGTTATLSCTVDGHPTPEVTWLHYENGKIIKVGQSSDLTVTVDSQTAGEYWCRADVDGFPPIEAAATVFIKGPPKIISNPTQYEIDDGTIRVVCLAFSVPRPDFLWTFDGKELQPSGQDYEFLEEALSEGLTKSTLMIREGRSIHFGTYNCTVQNSYGSDTFEIRLVPYKIPHYLLVISVPGVGIVGVVSIIVLFILCRRRRRRRMSDDDVKKPDVTNVGKGDCGERCNSDRSSNISELKLELRQIEGGYDAQSPNQSPCEYPAASGLELPLAGLVPLPNAGLNEKYMKYARYSTDFSDSTSNLHFKVSNQVNGYVQYVDYSKDYLPPVLNSDLSQSLIRSTDANRPYSEVRSNHKLKPSNSNQAVSALGTQDIGPDVIPFTSGDLCGGVDLSYAATYGNPYLKNKDPNMVYTNSIKAESSSAPPPPYYSLRNSVLPSAVATALPSSACLSQTHGSIANPNNISAQTQVFKGSPQSPSALYILPPPNRSSQSNHITKCLSTSGTHV